MPLFYFSDLVVGETTCDGKKKMYEYMAEFKAVHVMQLPNSSEDAASRALWKAEIEKPLSSLPYSLSRHPGTSAQTHQSRTRDWHYG